MNPPAGQPAGATPRETRWERVGPWAILFHLADPADDRAFFRVRAAMTELRERPVEGVREVVPAFNTLLMEWEPGWGIDPVAQAASLARRLGMAVDRPTAGMRRVELPVKYDGPDLSRVARLTGLPATEVVRRHTAAVYQVRMLGFAPGFAYLGGLDPALHVPRLETPRVRVPVGAVGIGGEHTGVYPVASPGGWNLIGTTLVRLFDPGSPDPDRMFSLRMGDEVVFRDLG